VQQQREVSMSIEANQTVDDIMRRWPATIRVFLRHRMRCVGCPIATFHTVEDACREHRTDRGRFLDELQAAADAPHPFMLGEAVVAVDA
jgi:hybrid cluster-associated redox disulfide protein